MRCRLGIALAVALVCAAANAAAAPAAIVFHVSPSGSDAGSGSEAQPFATLARAQQAVRAATATMSQNVVVDVAAGNYRLSAPLQLSDAAGDSGENGHRVIYQAHGYGSASSDQVTISGGSVVTGWEPSGSVSGAWQAAVGDLETRQLFVDGVRARRAALEEGLPGTVELTESGWETDSTAPQEWQGADEIELIREGPGIYPFAESRCGVAGISGDAGGTEIAVDEPCLQRSLLVYALGEPWAEGLEPNRLENSKSFLDQPGEFYLDRSVPHAHVLYYIPRPGEEMESAEVVAPRLEQLLVGSGGAGEPLHDVTVRGLTFADTTWLVPDQPEGYVEAFAGSYELGDPAEDPPEEGFYPDSNSIAPGAVSLDRSEDVRLVRNRLERLGGTGLLIARSNSDQVRGNVFADISANAIVLNAPRAPHDERGDLLVADAAEVSAGNRVVDNWLHGIGAEYRGSVGVFIVAGKDTTVAHNQVEDVAHNGIVTIGDAPEELEPPVLRADMANLRIVANRISNTLTHLDDGGGIYFAGETAPSWAEQAIVRGNLVTDGPAERGNAIGIYTDWLSRHMRISQNVVYGWQRSAGGCSIIRISDLRFVGNFWDREETPDWLAEAGEDCGAPIERIAVKDNTLLPGEDPAGACAADVACAAIVAKAGLEPEYQDLLE
jgi:hypothetical protein